jgi:hypothetical protein
MCEDSPIVRQDRHGHQQGDHSERASSDTLLPDTFYPLLIVLYGQCRDNRVD